MNRVIQFVLAVLLSFNFTYAQSQWQEIPGVTGGRIFAVAMTDAGDIFAGGESGGVYRSSDQGQSWSYAGLATRSVRTLHWHNGRLYAGLQSGLRWSDDGGSTWLASGMSSNQNGFGVAVNSQGHIYVAGWNGMYRSTDDGSTWEEVGVGSGFGTRLNHVAISANDRIIVTTSSKGIWQSNDDGATWASADALYDQQTGYEIVADGNRVAAAIPGIGVVFSADGSSWETRSTGLTNTNVISVLFAGGDILLAGSSSGEIHRSTDLGLSWTQIGSVTSEANQLVLAGSAIVVGAGYGGIVRSADGSTWETSNTGLTCLMISDIALSSAGDIYVCSHANTVLHSADDGATWTETGQEASAAYSVEVDASGRLYVVPGYYFYTSSDKGTTWVLDTAGLTQDRLLRVKVRDDGTVFASGSSGGGLFRSSGAGSVWTDISAGLPAGLIYTIGFAEGNIYCGPNGAGLYRSTDEGASWSQLTSGISGVFCGAIAYRESNGELFAAMGGYVYRSKDLGDSWTSLRFDYPGSQIVNIAFGPMDELLVSDQYGGVFIYHPGFEKWIDLSDGLVNSAVRAFIIMPDGTMYAGTNGNGLYRRSVPVLSAGQPVIAASMTLEQNYPNPFNPTTTLRYSLAHRGSVRLTLHDMLGRELRVLEENVSEAGTHKMTFDAGALSAGSYLYRLAFDGHTSTRIMTLLK